MSKKSHLLINGGLGNAFSLYLFTAMPSQYASCIKSFTTSILCSVADFGNYEIHSNNICAIVDLQIMKSHSLHERIGLGEMEWMKKIKRSICI